MELLLNSRKCKTFYCESWSITNDFFIPNELVGMIVEETNCYARQFIARKPDPKRQNTSREEMQAFFGLHMPYDYHILPKTSLYYM